MSVWPPQGVAGFAPDNCVPCCTDVCSMQLVLPLAIYGPVVPYADEAAAQAVIDAHTASCLAWANDGDLNAVADFAASFALGLLTLSGSVPDYTGTAEIDFAASLNLKSGATITVSWSGALPGLSDDDDSEVFFQLRKCDNSAILSNQATTLGGGGGSFTFLVPADGEYLLFCGVNGGLDVTDPVTGASAVFTASTDDGLLTVNPVAALWDDGGTTRTLTCPP